MEKPRSLAWITAGVLGISLATFLCDLGHECATAVLPLYLASIQLGPLGLGIVEGVADFVVSFSRLAGGVFGHFVPRKKPWTVWAYVVTSVATASIGLVQTLLPIVTMRTTAWIGRGFRGPLRDYLLAENVPVTHYGRAYGLERAADMLGAVSGPLVAVSLLWIGLPIWHIIVWTFIPGILAALTMQFLVTEKDESMTLGGNSNISGASAARSPHFPGTFWLFLVGVLFFGLGDFSRTFLILLAAKALNADFDAPAGILSLPILLYVLHNMVSALAALPVGSWGDRSGKLGILIVGYGLGVGTNVLLALWGSSLSGVTCAVILSGIYIAVEETLEKATAAEMLSRDLRSLGFGYLGCVNAVGDMLSSIYVGYVWEQGHIAGAFLLAASFGACGVLWLGVLYLRQTWSSSGR